MGYLPRVFMMNWAWWERKGNMGGKSRKTGSVSKALVDRIKAQQAKATGGKKDNKVIKKGRGKPKEESTNLFNE